MATTQSRPDLAIVGSGSAAFAAAIAAVGHGRSVVMIERDTVGGTCVNVGCVPSKTLLAAAEARHAAAAADRFPGLGAAAVPLDFPGLIAGKDALVAQLPALMLSIAAAAIVTRVTSKHDLSGQIGSQFNSVRTWTPVAVILGLLGLMPGMPHLVLLTFAALAGAMAWHLHKKSKLPVYFLSSPK